MIWQRFPVFVHVFPGFPGKEVELLSRISRMLIYFLAAAKRTKNLFGQMNKHLSRRVLFISVEYATEINALRGCGKEME